MQVILILNTTHENVGGSEIPQPYAGFLSWFGFLTLDVIQLVPFDCAYERSFDHLDALLLVTLVPPLLLAAAVALTLYARAKKWKSVGSLSDTFSMWLTVIFLVLPVIARRISQSFRCSEYGACALKIPAYFRTFLESHIHNAHYRTRMSFVSQTTGSTATSRATRRWTATRRDTRRCSDSPL